MNVRESDTPLAFGSRWGPEKREKNIRKIKPSVRRKQEVTYYDDARDVFRPLNRANDLSDFEIEECKEAFSSFDTAGEGHISTDHLEQLLKIMGHSPTLDEIANILEEVDEDGELIGLDYLYVQTGTVLQDFTQDPDSEDAKLLDPPDEGEDEDIDDEGFEEQDELDDLTMILQYVLHLLKFCYQHRKQYK